MNPYMNTHSVLHNMRVLEALAEPIGKAPEEFKFWRDAEGEARTIFFQWIVYHSPDGFEWGYNGSGPADCALNILAFCVDGKTAIRLHQKFKDEWLTKLPNEGGSITLCQVLGWISEVTDAEERSSQS